MFCLRFFSAIFYLIIHIALGYVRSPVKGVFQMNVDMPSGINPFHGQGVPPPSPLLHSMRPPINGLSRPRPPFDLNFLDSWKKPQPDTKPNPPFSPKSDGNCNPQTQYIMIPQCNPSSGSMFSNVPSVALFTNTFLDAVYCNDILREVLDLSQTHAKQYSDFLTKYGEEYLSRQCLENAADLAEFAFRAVAPNFDVLTLPVVARFYANAAANFLYTDGFLCMDNAEDLALIYAKAIFDSAQVTMTSDPTSKFMALPDGFVNFFDSLGLWTTEKAPFLAFYVGNEWFNAAVNYRWC